MVDKSDVTSDAQFTQRLQYHQHLANSRWQYFATYTAISALVYNAWTQIQGTDPVTKMLICLGIIFAAITTLRLISRARTRIRANAIEINRLAQEEILEVGKGAGFRGVTLWLYVSVIALSLPWFKMLFDTTYYAFAFAVAIMLLNLATLSIWHGK